MAKTLLDDRLHELQDQADEDASALSFITGFVLGLMIGLIVAVLLAPEAGRDAREQAFQTGIELLPGRQA